VLRLDQRLPAAKEIACPGFPRGSFNYVSFDGLFEGHFNRLDLVIDSSNQVVCIQLVDENPKSTDYNSFARKGDYSTFNFVEYRVKAINTMKVEYSLEELFKETTSYVSRVAVPLKWTYVQVLHPKETVQLRRVNTVLLDKANKRKEETQWYIPRPLADLILYCISRGQ
jgi:hypothetical protein